MKKLVISLVSLIFLHAGLQAAIPAAAAPESPVYTNFNRNYQLIFPQGWQVKRNFMELDVYAAAPEENPHLGSRANISVISSEGKEELGLDQYFTQNRDTLKNAILDYKELETGTVFVNGLTGRKLVYTYNSRDVDMKVTQYFLLKGKKGYVITYQAAADVYPKYVDSFEAAIRSFKLL